MADGGNRRSARILAQMELKNKIPIVEMNDEAARQ